jgi:hypothetical protein
VLVYYHFDSDFVISLQETKKKKEKRKIIKI